MTIPSYPFSIQANRVLNLAALDAKKRNHGFIEPEHILLGLLEDQKNVAKYILSAIGIDIRSLKASLLVVLDDYAHNNDSAIYSERSKKILELGMQSSGATFRQYFGTEHLLIGILRNLGTQAYSILRKSGVNYGEVLSQAKVMPPENLPDERKYLGPVTPGDRITLVKHLLMISPIFWALVGLALIAGFGLFYDLIPEKTGAFIFVTISWIVFVSLHEFSHALVAYWGGDYSVLDKGYLTLNPLRYSHGLMSIVLPLVIIAMRGIGLPGAAVNINMGLIPNKGVRSLVSAAGPLMTALITIILSIPFMFNLHITSIGAPDFWIGLAFLIFIQITVLVFNLIPLPGLDGFGIIRPFLPQRVAILSNTLGGITFLLILFMFTTDSVLSRFFWTLIEGAITAINISFDMVRLGFQLYQLW